MGGEETKKGRKMEVLCKGEKRKVREPETHQLWGQKGVNLGEKQNLREKTCLLQGNDLPHNNLPQSPYTHKTQYKTSCTVQFSSVAQSCPTLCDPMNCSTPGLPVHHHLPEFTQTHVPQISDAIQPSHPLSSPSPPAFNLSQHQGLFQ